MATVVNARDIAIDGAAHISVTIPGSLGWSGVTNDDGNKPANNADVTGTVVNGGLTVTSGGITLSAGGSIKGGQTAYATGTGWFLGYAGGVYKFSIGDATNYLKWSGTAMTFAGDLTGAGSITWTGPAKFDGVATVSGVNVCVAVNTAVNQDYGVMSFGKVCAVYAANFGGATGIGVRAAGGTGLALSLEGTGKMIQFPAAQLSTGAVTPAFNNKPNTGTTVKWFPTYDAAGNKWWIPMVAD